MQRRFSPFHLARIAALTLTLLADPLAAGGRPQVWGYGVKGCPEFLRAALPPDSAGADTPAEQARFREWFAGMVTGLSLATDLDVLQGNDIEAAFQRLRRICEGRPGEDFFTAANELVRELNQPDAPAREARVEPKDAPPAVPVPAPKEKAHHHRGSPRGVAAWGEVPSLPRLQRGGGGLHCQQSRQWLPLKWRAEGAGTCK
jgi:hypothetical protein